MSAGRARWAAIATCFGALLTLTACAAPPPGVVPSEVTVSEPVAQLVARNSFRDLSANARCETVNKLVFALVSEFGENLPEFSSTERAGAILIHGTMGQFFEEQVSAELNRKGVTGFAAQRAQASLFEAYVQSYIGMDYPNGSPQRRAQIGRVLTDLEFCNRDLAGLPF